MNRIEKSLLAFSLLPLLLAGSCEKNTDENNNIAPPSSTTNSAETDVTVYLSTADESYKFKEQDTSFVFGVSDVDLSTITIDTNTQYQTIDGFGFALTGGSAKLLSSLTSSARKSLLEELFDSTSTNIGISYLRVSIGSSDLDEYTFSYNSTTSDTNMTNFDLGYDKKYLIPVLKEILAINPNIKIVGSPWSAPVWMKTNNSTIGGSLQKKYYSAYASYFVKYIEGMADEGITIGAITIQNEPLNGNNNPSMEMSADEQTYFVKNNLGPAFEEAGITTKIIIYDHNADNTDYSMSILNNKDAYNYVDGTAFHLYAGDISALTTVHTAFPEKSLYFSEQWVGSPSDFGSDLNWHIREVIIGSTRNWSKFALEWNLASDENLEPHTEGGCEDCLGALTIEGESITRNTSYYIIAHASKFVRPGSVRIKSNTSSDLPNVAFLTPDNQIVTIILNDSSSNQTFNISVGDESFATTMESGSVGTFIIEL